MKNRAVKEKEEQKAPDVKNQIKHSYYVSALHYVLPKDTKLNGTQSLL